MPSQAEPGGARRRYFQFYEGTDAEPKAAPAYTNEQFEAVRRINRCTCFYEIFGVCRSASRTDIQKKYKRLALLCHPDKNSAPGAEEAMKKIGSAFAVLNNSEKRRIYDNPAEQAPPPSPPSRGPRARRHGGPTFTKRDYQSNQHNARNGTSTQAKPFPQHVVTVVVILIICFYTCIVIMRVNQPNKHHENGLVGNAAYKLQRSSVYSHQRKTFNLDIPYYVQENFLEKFKGDIYKIEREIEEDLPKACFREKQRKEEMIRQAQLYSSKYSIAEAYAIGTPSCDILSKFYTVQKD